jgi:hypothetical protein
MTRGLLSICLLALLPAAVWPQTPAVTLPEGTPLPARIAGPLPMKRGQPVRAELLYPVYADNLLILPAGTPLIGSVIDLKPDRKRRVRAILGGDFTPFRIPIVQFNALQLPDGSTLPIAAAPATEGAPIFPAVSPPPTHGGFLHREFETGLTVARDDLSIFLAPGKGDRFVQFIYSQIPYHPQRIAPGTAWTIETTQDVDVPAQPAPPPPVPVVAPRKPHFWEPHPPPPPAANGDSSRWMIRAYLTESLSSQTSKAGEEIHAVVAEPVRNPDDTIAVPQGATLVGTITRAQPSRNFGRAGVLTFYFRELQLPGTEQAQAIETRLASADSSSNIALNSEGQPKAAPQDKLAIPLLLAAMASRPLDHDHRTDNMVGKDAVGGSAGLGLVGTIIGLAGGSANVSAGIGYWGAARAFYSRWIARGQTIAFAKNTRIVVETTPRRSAPIKPDATR